MAETATFCEKRSTQVFHEREKLPTRKPQRLVYKTWDGPRPSPYGRAVSLQKTKAASKLYGRAGFPQFSGEISGHGVPSHWQIWLGKLGKSMADFFYPRQGMQAMAASEWLEEAQQWQGMPWYEPILGQLSFRHEGNQVRESESRAQAFNVNSNAASTRPLRAVFQKAPAKSPMVGAEFFKSRSNGTNTTWCAGLKSPAKQAFFSALQKKSGRNPNGFGNNSGVFGSWSSERNKIAGSKTFNSLVCRQKGRQIEVDNQLQGNEPFSGTKTIKAREFAIKFSFF